MVSVQEPVPVQAPPHPVNVQPGEATEGSAKYAVVREQTGVLLGDLNSALGTNFSLP
jgi:hypothetical protein